MKMKFIAICSLLLFLTGCWDQVEIDNRGFVIGAAIDIADEKKIRLTQQVVIPTGLQAGGSGQGGGGGGGGEGKSYLNIEETGDSILQIVRRVSGRLSRFPYYGHVKAVIISNELVEEKDLAEILDFFIRGSEMRRSIIVFISDGEARKLIDVMPPGESLPILYLTAITKSTFRNVEIYPQRRIGDIHNYFMQERTFGIPMIKDGKGLLQLTETAIISGDERKMAGKLNAIETVGFVFVLDKVKGGTLEIKEKNEEVTVEIHRSQTRLKITGDSPEQLVFTLDVKTDVILSESHLSLDFLKESRKKEIEKLIEKKIHTYMMQAIEKTQQEIKKEPFNFGRKLHAEKNELWENIKDDWDAGKNYYSEAEVNVNVNVTIKNTGSINKSK